MPRTKRPTSKKEKVTDEDDALKKMSRLVAEQKKKVDIGVQMRCGDIEMAFKILIGSIPPSTLQKTIGELKNELLLREVPKSSMRRTRNSSHSTSQDDGYLTEGSSQGSGDRRRMAPPSVTRPPSAARTAPRRSRSADTARRAAPSPAPPGRRARSVYRTPACARAAHYPAITPKVTPQTPMTLLRQPRQGEMVVSLSGSPVMVPTYNNLNPDAKANCNIMLEDGTMLSLQPKSIRQSQAFIPFSLMGSTVLSQLKTLQDNLAKVVTLGESQMQRPV